MIFEAPRLISFPKIGNPDLGYISISENSKHIPFDVKRVFWTYDMPANVVRGHHAHYITEMVLIAVAGTIIVHTEMPDGSAAVFTLSQPHTGIYLPKYCWHSMEYTKGAVQTVMANTTYVEDDYIRSYDDFKAISNNK